MTSQVSPKAPLLHSLDGPTAIVGPLVVFVLSWATASVREGMGIANVSLVLAMVTVLAALVSWLAGLATSIVAALSLNYFHTEPVHSLRISAGRDLVAVGLLAALGLAVSAVTAMRVRRTAVDRRAADADAAARRLRELLESDRPVNKLWELSLSAASAQFGLIDTRVEATGSSFLPVVSRQPWRPSDAKSDHMMMLPEGGAVVNFRDPQHHEQLVLTPRAGMGAVLIDRRVALVFVDQIELALDHLDRSQTTNLNTPNSTPVTMQHTDR